MPIFLNTNKNILFIHPPKLEGIYSEYLSNFGFRSLHSKRRVWKLYSQSTSSLWEMIKSIEKLGIKILGLQ